MAPLLHSYAHSIPAHRPRGGPTTRPAAANYLSSRAARPNRTPTYLRRAHARTRGEVPEDTATPSCGDRGGPDRGPGGDGEVASCTRSLLPLGRFDEAERLLEEARAVQPPGSGVRVLAAAAEALLLARDASSSRRRRWRARRSRLLRPGRTTSGGRRGPRHRARARRTDRRGASSTRAIAGIWRRKGCPPCAERVREQIQSLAARRRR